MLCKLHLMDYSILIAIEKINKDALIEKYFSKVDLLKKELTRNTEHTVLNYTLPNTPSQPRSSSDMLK